jgi:hypothetical protein
MNDSSLYYYVQLPDGDVHRVTLDQLDEGYQSGCVGAGTMVLASGATAWTRLGALAGLEEAPVGHAAVYSQRPVSVDLTEELSRLRAGGRKRWLAGFGTVVVLGSLCAAFLARPGLRHWIDRVSHFRQHGSAVAVPQLPSHPAESTWAPVSDPPTAPVIAAVPPSASAVPANAAVVAVPPASRSVDSASDARPHDGGGAAKTPDRSTAADRPRALAPLAAKTAHPPNSGVTSAPKKTSSAFVTTGNKYDPLNSGI